MAPVKREASPDGTAEPGTAKRVRSDPQPVEGARGPAGDAACASEAPPAAASTHAEARQVLAEEAKPKQAEAALKGEKASSSPTRSDVDLVAAAHLEPLGLKLGERIEVNWQLEEGEGAEATKRSRWWGAVIQEVITRTEPSGRVACVSADEASDSATRKEALPESAKGVPVLRLLYDAYNDFEPETRRVALLDATWLWDCDDGAEMLWKKEGADDPVVENDDEPVDVATLAAQMETSAAENEAAAAAALAQMPRPQAIAMVEGYNRLVDHLKDGIRELVSSGTNVIDEDAIRRIMSNMQR